MRTISALCFVAVTLAGATSPDFESKVKHGYADFWYTWRNQREALADSYQVVAIDQRGYNLRDKPAGVENYDMRLLVGDVIAVIQHLGKEKAIIIGHDWGGV